MIDEKGKKVLIPAEYFKKSSGGNNRKWVQRYRAMESGLRILKELDDRSERHKALVLGYELAWNQFNNKDI